MAVNRKLVQDLADEVVERAREQADEVLVEAREQADLKLEDEGQVTRASTELAREALAQERSDEDVVLQAERSSADQSLLWEREEQARILAALLPLEREGTDRYLLTERGISDRAVVNRDDLLGMVGHDLQKLLAGIAVEARVLANGVSDSEEGKRTLRGVVRVEHYVACMNRLIGDLLDVTGIDAGKLALHPSPADVAELIAEGIAPFAQTAQEKGCVWAMPRKGRGWRESLTGAGCCR